MSFRAAVVAWVLVWLVGSGCGPRGETDAESQPGGDAAAAGGLRPVDEDRVRAAAEEPQSWLTHGGTYAEQRYSSLSQIDESNVAELGLAWSFDLDTQRGVEATPLVADGVMYVTAPWSLLHALDAATGEHLWTYDPGVPREFARSICCGVVNRGAALWGDKVFVGTLDGRLVGVDRATGEPVWETLTTEPTFPYSITGAPRVVEGLVVIGNAGADYGARGYVSAYRAETGELAWRTYTVPGNPADGFESEAMERAAETWTGEWWKAGGGGTVWDAMAHDPELGLLYVGTGNGSPFPRWLRSPGGGDNLYLASILALRPQTGELVWHYQTTPAETWDYTATQHLMLVDLEIEGRPRKLILQAPKNGFFFVLDRETGEFLSAEPIVEVTWATGYDAQGRPIEGDVDYSREPKFTKPSPYGAHTWPPMSFHPGTGLVYLPVRGHGLPVPDEDRLVLPEGRLEHGARPLVDRQLGRGAGHQHPGLPAGLGPRSPGARPGACRTSRPSTGARSRPRATWCSRAPPTGASRPTAPATARGSGRCPPVPASPPGRSATGSAASSTWRWPRAGARRSPWAPEMPPGWPACAAAGAC